MLTTSPHRQTLWLAKLLSLLELRQVKCATLTKKEEQEHCTTIKSTAVTIYFELAEKDCAFNKQGESSNPLRRFFHST
jgi:hypothetical protein